jgi:hypothetical protein
MVDASHLFDCTKAHAIEGYGDTEGFDLWRVVEVRIVSELVTTVSAEVALLAIAMTILNNFVTSKMRTVHDASLDTLSFSIMQCPTLMSMVYCIEQGWLSRISLALTSVALS